jgi:hypothetical protein
MFQTYKFERDEKMIMNDKWRFRRRCYQPISRYFSLQWASVDWWKPRKPVVRTACNPKRFETGISFKYKVISVAATLICLATREIQFQWLCQNSTFHFINKGLQDEGSYYPQPRALTMLVPMAARSKSRTAGSNPARGIDVCPHISVLCCPE